MKKRLFLSNNKGFFLPYVVILAAIILMLLLHSVKLYQNEIKISANLMSQIEYETLYQMGLTKFMKDKPFKTMETDEITYVFPSGNVIVDYFYAEVDVVRVHLQVSNKKDHQYDFYQYVRVRN